MTRSDNIILTLRSTVSHESTVSNKNYRFRNKEQTACFVHFERLKESNILFHILVFECNQSKRPESKCE